VILWVMLIFMDIRKKKITRRKFLKASGKVAGAVASKGGKLKGVGELIMPQEASRPGIGHLYQEVRRDLKGKVLSYGGVWVEETKTNQKTWELPAGARSGPSISKGEYLGEVDLSDFETRSVADLDYDSSGWPEGPPQNRRSIPDFDEISEDLNDQMHYEETSGHFGLENKKDHMWVDDEYGQRVKRLSHTTKKLSHKLSKSHWLQEQAKKQIKSRSQRLLEHQNQQKQIQSQKKPSQVKQKVTQAIDLAKESPKTSSIISGLSRFSGVLAGLELADANPFSPPKLGAPGIAEWKLQEEKRKKKLVVQ